MRFDYFEPATLEEAGDLLREGKGARKPLAGGTDIVIQLRRRVVSTQGLVNLKRIPELWGWAREPGEGAPARSVHAHARPGDRRRRGRAFSLHHRGASGGGIAAVEEHRQRGRQPVQRLAVGGHGAAAGGARSHGQRDDPRIRAGNGACGEFLRGARRVGAGHGADCSWGWRCRSRSRAPGTPSSASRRGRPWTSPSPAPRRR